MTQTQNCYERFVGVRLTAKQFERRQRLLRYGELQTVMNALVDKAFDFIEQNPTNIALLRGGHYALIGDPSDVRPPLAEAEHPAPPADRETGADTGDTPEPPNTQAPPQDQGNATQTP